MFVKNKVKVFIASPYTRGDVNINMNNQRNTSNTLIDLGFNPLPIALLYHQLNLEVERNYQLWIDLTIEWVKKSDCLLRLPGESKGADGEVELALKLGIPVFYSVNDLKNYYGI